MLASSTFDHSNHSHIHSCTSTQHSTSSPTHSARQPPVSPDQGSTHSSTPPPDAQENKDREPSSTSPTHSPTPSITHEGEDVDASELSVDVSESWMDLAPPQQVIPSISFAPMEGESHSHPHIHSHVDAVSNDILTHSPPYSPSTHSLHSQRSHHTPVIHFDEALPSTHTHTMNMDDGQVVEASKDTTDTDMQPGSAVNHGRVADDDDQAKCERVYDEVHQRMKDEIVRYRSVRPFFILLLGSMRASCIYENHIYHMYPTISVHLCDCVVEPTVS